MTRSSLIKTTILLATAALLALPAAGWARPKGLVPTAKGYKRVNTWNLRHGTTIKHTTFYNKDMKRTGHRRQSLGSSGRKSVRSQTNLRHGVRVRHNSKFDASGTRTKAARIATGKKQTVRDGNRRMKYTFTNRPHTTRLSTYHGNGVLATRHTTNTKKTRTGFSQRDNVVKYDKKGVESSSVKKTRWRLKNSVLSGYMKNETRLGSTGPMTGIRYNVTFGHGKTNSKVTATPFRKPGKAPGVK